MKVHTKQAALILCTVLCCTLITANLHALAENITAPPVITGNKAPVADQMEFTTFRNVAISEKLTAVDPDGDVITFELLAPPKKGTVIIAEDGAFVYTPKENYKGKDNFTYAAVDIAGNVSEETSVKITVKKQSGKTAYADMDGNSAAYAALVLSEKGVFTGEQLGSEYFFRPDAPVTRGEFLAMCLKAGDADMLTGVTRTGFTDDEEIPLWVKPYVTTALMSGVISGYKDGDGNLVFSPDEPVTFSEASVILNNLLGISDVVSVSAIRSDPDIPVWAYTATVNLTTCNILPQGVTNMYSRHVTRADAAKMLLSAGEQFENDGNSLLSWAQ